MERPYRVRRSCLAVPASSERFIEKARGLPADEVFLGPRRRRFPAVGGPNKKLLAETVTELAVWGAAPAVPAVAPTARAAPVRAAAAMAA